ncbi:hypothetical protein [Tropicimonas isoalkanivorans]|uniref:Uncharacterized protein n=1 Tax=Tropicimonas isoalkanivorans TaxID=441112 RepID=A0A1I1ECS6_9RHOB|nr:hypothetical protein [Tropicimonas isoalkanivorans]SFB84949.1 hypothetical protein SAMN04488094_101756 [Tropicimonas isoalkanivorans]
MTWCEFLQEWHGQLHRLQTLFPYADATALARFRGNKHLLTEYIANTHDLTLSEGLEALELRLLPGAQAKTTFAYAAE